MAEGTPLHGRAEGQEALVGARPLFRSSGDGTRGLSFACSVRAVPVIYTPETPEAHS